jgi:hypothetical protein
MKRAKHFCEVMTDKGRCLKPATAKVKFPYSREYWECAEHLAQSKKEKGFSVVGYRSRDGIRSLILGKLRRTKKEKIGTRAWRIK